MITVKEYENEVGRISQSLLRLYRRSTTEAIDLKILAARVESLSYELLNLTLRFRGQEEA